MIKRILIALLIPVLTVCYITYMILGSILWVFTGNEPNILWIDETFEKITTKYL